MSHECNGECWNRRDFLSAATMSAVAALLAACGDGQIGGPLGPAGTSAASPNGGAPLAVRLADYPALARDGGIARINGSAAPVAVVRLSASNYRALSLACPHQGTTVNIGTGSFTCPNHGARFAADGTWTGGQSTSSLLVIPSTFDPAAGTLTINGAGGQLPTGKSGGDDDDDDDDDD